MKVTPWEVEGEVDYERLLREFGAAPLDIRGMELPKPVLLPLRRGYFYAHRDFDKFVEDWREGKRVSIVTGRGPSGPMHLGHILPFYTAKWFQDKMDAFVFIPISDDEKYLVKRKLKVKDVESFALNNVLDILSVGFNPEKTRIAIDMKDTELYRPAVVVSKRVTFSTMRALFGLTQESNVGWVFYPAMQMVHLYIPQILYGPHRVLVPVAIDQDPYIRVARDVAESIGLVKTAGLLSKFMPSLESPSGKMSTSDGGEEKVIWLTDDRDTIRRKIMKYAFSGGQPTVEEHRKYGGRPEIDVSFLYLYYFFEEDDRKIREIEEGYRSGELLTGELKDYAAKKIADFLEAHQKRKEKLLRRDLEDVVESFSFREDERRRIKEWGREF